MSFRENLSNKIIMLAEASGGYVFGGYVRDKIAKKAFNDIDLYFGFAGDLIKLDLFVVNLYSQNIHVVSSQNPESYFVEYFRRKLNVIDYFSNLQISVDCIMSHDNVLSPFKPGRDADINYLYMKGNEIYAAEGFDKDQIISNIKNRKFVADESVKENRIIKLTNKGFSRIYEDNTTKNCLVCNGTGELDFGFYKRLCGCRLG